MRDGHFFKSPVASILYGRYKTLCPRCNGNVTLTLQVINKRLTAISSNIRVIDKVYRGHGNNIKCKCLKHNYIFLASPSNILAGKECKFCRFEKMTETRLGKSRVQFDDKAKIANPDIMRLENYMGAKIPINFQCKKCNHIWKAMPCNILGKKGCPNCIGKISKSEKAWLDYINIPNDSSHRQVYMNVSGVKYSFDGYDPHKKIVYDFLGDYYHGNPKKFKRSDINPTVKKTFGEIYDNTMMRIKFLEDNGYKVVIMWENDFKKIYNYAPYKK